MNLLLTKDEAWGIYQANGGRGVPPRDQVHSVAIAQLKKALESMEYWEAVNLIVRRIWDDGRREALHEETIGNDVDYTDEILALLEE